jgi:hypothetical protein
MNRQLLEDLHGYFEKLSGRSKAEEYLFLQLSEELPHFHITGIHRDDLKRAGFDISNVTDIQMEELADKMADDYCEQLYWDSLSIIAADSVGIPRLTKKEEFIGKIKEIAAGYGAFNTADVEADVAPCIQSGADGVVFAEFFLENGVTATTYDEKTCLETRHPYYPYEELGEETLREIYELAQQWEAKND